MRPARRHPQFGGASLEQLEDRRLFTLLNAVADSFVRDGAFASTNFGAAPLLYSKDAAGDTREADLKFDISSTGPIGTAILRFDAKLQTDSTPDTRVGIFGVTDPGWIEGNGTTTDASGDGSDTDNNPPGELTFNNRPAVTSDQPFDIITISGGVQQSYALDVSTFVHDQQSGDHNLVGFVLRSLDPGSDFVAYVSRDDADFGPVLDVHEDAGPTSSLSASDITAPGGATSTIVVTYQDPEDVDVLSLSDDDISVTAPDGTPVNVSNFAPAPNANASTLAVTYTLDAPGGAWDDADAGTYLVRLNAGQVSDAFENFAPPEALGSFNVVSSTPPTDDGLGPTATLNAVPAISSGDQTLALSVTFTDDTAVDASDAGIGNLIVTQNGNATPLLIQSASPDSTQDGPTRTFTYVVAAPGGSWDPADDGTYTVSLAANQVSDTSDHFADATTLGTFDVNLTGSGQTGTQKGSFGAVNGAKKPTSLTFTDDDGTAVTVSLKGGSGQVFDRSGVFDLDLAGTTAASALSIKTKGGNGRVTLGNITGAALKSLSGKTADLSGGNITMSGGLGTLQLGNINNATLTCAAGGVLSLTAGSIDNFSINSGSAIKAIKAAAWADDDATADAINAPTIGIMTIAGDFAADVNTATIKSLKVAGSLTGATVRASDSIGKVTLGSMNASSIFAGISSAVTTLPSTAADFANPAATIGGVSVKSTFAAGCVIAGPTIGKLSLATIQTDNAGVAFGVMADVLSSLTALANGSRLKLAKLSDPSQSHTIADFDVRMI